jgi:hypothetical protein
MMRMRRRRRKKKEGTKRRRRRRRDIQSSRVGSVWRHRGRISLM